jgi:hypothetical protein
LTCAGSRLDLSDKLHQAVHYGANIPVKLRPLRRDIAGVVDNRGL